MSSSLRLIPLLPFIGAALLLLFGRRWKRHTVRVIATASIAAACFVTLDAFFFRLPAVSEHGGLHDHLWTWMSSGSLKVEFDFRMDALSGVLCCVITFIGTLIHIYATEYMADEPDYARFFGYLNLFCGAMLVLVLGDSLPVMFIGWEGVGLCSYLLIGFWYAKTANADAGKKAFITNRIGDLGFLLGMFLLFRHTGALDFGGITAGATAGGALTQPSYGGMSVAFWVGVLLFIGACGKSAQLPLYVWLPDAMAGPTPVSALIHAATMVTAGVYMVARLNAVYMLAPAAMAIVAVVGAATAVFAAVIGFAQNDFKKVLAYSTVSQLGFMFAGVGTANFAGGVFHLYTHAFFKAGLFLCAGSVMHAMSGSGDITQMGGLRRRMPWTHAVFAVCWLAIIGAPLFSGFFSKDAIIAGAWATPVFAETSVPWVGKLVWLMLTLAALGTAFYMSRLYFLVFSGKSRADEHTQAHAHESPDAMVGPLVVLAIGALAAGWVGTPFGEHGSPFARWLTPVVGSELHISHALEYGLMGVAVVIAIVGVAVAYAFYGGGYRAPAHKVAAAFPAFVALVRDKFRVDELYGLLIIRPIQRMAAALFFVVDRIIIDQLLVGGAAFVVDMSGRVARSFQVGDVQRYMAVLTLGAGGLLYFATRPAAPFQDLKIDIAGLSVTVDAGRRVKESTRTFTYELDCGGGRPVHLRNDAPEARCDFPGPGTYTIEMRVIDSRWRTSSTLARKVRVSRGSL